MGFHFLPNFLHTQTYINVLSLSENNYENILSKFDSELWKQLCGIKFLL